MHPRSIEPEILLLHEGELADVRELLAEIGLDPTERLQGPAPEDLASPWDLVIASPQPMLDLDDAARGATRIAVLGEDSRTLRAVLRRSGVDYTVRRPVHRSALRLLLLHAVYRGPEKRRNRRVSVGARVQYRAGWRRRSGVLADLSLTGCRLLTESFVRRGKRVTIWLPAEVGGGRPVRVRGSVVRSGTAIGAPPGTQTLALAFEGLSPDVFRRLEEVVGLHRSGPALYEPAEGAPDAAEEAEDEAADRRDSPRHSLARHIIALGQSTAPVLMGRDISVGGMRVDAHSDVKVGDGLQLAIHVRAREEPLVVGATVARDDGPRGMVLQFDALSPPARSYLERMLDALPILEMGGPRDDEDAGVVVSQILERQRA